jgi:hypothetical protein
VGQGSNLDISGPIETVQGKIKDVAMLKGEGQRWQSFLAEDSFKKWIK